MLFAFHMLLAQAEQQQQSTGGSAWPQLFPLLAIPVLAWFFLIRPMRRQEQERNTLLNSLKKNDRVLTSGGIYGIVANIKEKEDEVTLKVDESSNVRLRVTKSSIVKILTGEEPVKEQKNGGA